MLLLVQVLAIMACNKNLYKPKPIRTQKTINFGFIAKYDNKGMFSKIINK